MKQHVQPWSTASPARSAAPSRRSIRRAAGCRGRARLLASAAVLVATFSVLLVPSASAHTAAISSQHSLTLAGGVFAGQLSATAPECMNARAITLYRAGATGAVAVSSATTGSTGDWTRPTSGLQDGAYYAVAASKLVTQQGHKHTCSAATSNNVTLAVDTDADGYTAAGGDCNDTNPAIHPGATEVRNSIDDDCDGLVDEGLPVDGDADGYTTAGGDCNDTNPAIHPGATEVRNGIDDDCDGSVDEGTGTGVACTEPVVIHSVSYCTATGEDIIYGRYPDGTPLVLRGLIAELEDRYLWLAANPECPVGMFCAPVLDWGYVYFPDDPVPAWADYVDVWGLAESSQATGSGGGGMRAVGWTKTG
jgi:Putative metal-binding motif